jgi:hypothetical protein
MDRDMVLEAGFGLQVSDRFQRSTEAATVIEIRINRVTVKNRASFCILVVTAGKTTVAPEVHQKWSLENST